MENIQRLLVKNGIPQSELDKIKRRDLTCPGAEMLARPSTALAAYFIWSLSPQGSDYWQKHFLRLVEMEESSNAK